MQANGKKETPEEMLARELRKVREGAAPDPVGELQASRKSAATKIQERRCREGEREGESEGEREGGRERERESSPA